MEDAETFGFWTLKPFISQEKIFGQGIQVTILHTILDGKKIKSIYSRKWHLILLS